MARFLTSHTMACMTRQDLQHLVTLLSETGPDALLAWMGRKKIHHDWVERVDIEATPEGTKDL